MFAYFHDTPGHNTTWAAILTGFRVLLRELQITASESVLLRSDFTFCHWDMIIQMRKSPQKGSCWFQYPDVKLRSYALSIGLKSTLQKFQLPLIQQPFWCLQHPTFRLSCIVNFSQPLKYVQLCWGSTPPCFHATHLDMAVQSFCTSRVCLFIRLKPGGIAAQIAYVNTQSDCVCKYAM